MRTILPHRVMLSIAIITGLWLWWTITYAPVATTIPLAPSHVVGIWAPEANGAWTNGDTHITAAAQAHWPWRLVSWQWRQQAGSALDVTIQNDARIVGRTTTVPAWRRVVVLLQPDSTQLVIQSTTMRVAGDRRDLGVFITAPVVRALPVPWWSAVVRIVDLWLPLLAVIWWLWRGRWWGVAASTCLALVYGALVWHESQNGMQHPTLWLDDTGRYLSTAVLLVWAWRSRTRHVVAQAMTGRRFGLDIMRAIAVMCVIIAHFTPLMFREWSSTPDSYRWTLYLGAVGVDIFFALSGYLIGGILWRVLPRIHERAVLVRFWMRRWLRTLPAAYVSALIVWVLAPPRDVWQYVASILFVGTFSPWHISSENAHWWSLGAEEMFYLVFPLVLYGIARRWPKTGVFVLALGIFTAVIVLVRMVLLWVLPLDIVGHTEIMSYVRLDSMVWGVLIQWMRRRYAERFQQLAHIGFAPGVVVMATGIMLLLDQTRWYMVALLLGHTLITGGAALLIPAFEHVYTLGWRKLDQLCVGIALVSYSAYLYHIMMVDALLRAYGSATSWSMFGLLLVAYLAMTFIGASISYRVVEVPILRWRDRRFPDQEMISEQKT